MSGCAALTRADRERLARLETVIGNGLQDFVRVGEALLEVRDRELWRGEYDSFSDYCDRRWRLKQRRVYQLIDSARVVANLADCTTVQLLPANERQVRPLTGLEPERQQEVWSAAVEAAGGELPTAEEVEEAVEDTLALPDQPIETMTAAEQLEALRPRKNKPGAKRKKRGAKRWLKLVRHLQRARNDGEKDLDDKEIREQPGWTEDTRGVLDAINHAIKLADKVTRKRRY